MPVDRLTILKLVKKYFGIFEGKRIPTLTMTPDNFFAYSQELVNTNQLITPEELATLKEKAWMYDSLSK